MQRIPPACTASHEQNPGTRKGTGGRGGDRLSKYPVMRVPCISCHPLPPFSSCRLQFCCILNFGYSPTVHFTILLLLLLVLLLLFPPRVCLPSLQPLIHDRSFPIHPQHATTRLGPVPSILADSNSPPPSIPPKQPTQTRPDPFTRPCILQILSFFFFTLHPLRMPAARCPPPSAADTGGI